MDQKAEVSLWRERSLTCGELEFQIVLHRDRPVFRIVRASEEELLMMQNILNYLRRRYDFYCYRLRGMLAQTPREFGRYFPAVERQLYAHKSKFALELAMTGPRSANASIMPLEDIFTANVALGSDDILSLSKQMFELMMFCHSVNILPSFHLENFALVVKERQIVMMNWLDARYHPWLDQEIWRPQITEAAQNLLLLSRAQFGSTRRWSLPRNCSGAELHTLETLLAGVDGEFPTAAEIYLRLEEVEKIHEE